MILLAQHSTMSRDIAVINLSFGRFINNHGCCSSIKPHFHRLAKLLRFEVFGPYRVFVVVDYLNLKAILTTATVISIAKVLDEYLSDGLNKHQS